MARQDDTNKLAGTAGMRFIADTTPHDIKANTIIVCEDAVFAVLEYEGGENALNKLHAPANTVRSAWCTPITADVSRSIKRKGPFRRVQLDSGTIAIYHDYL